MESETEEVKSSLVEPLFKVTTLSKYLALVLFIMLPFLGGYIGYVYAPEKVVEVERVVVQENNVVESDHSLLPNYAQFSAEEKSATQNQFVNVKNILTIAPFAWEMSDPYREYRLLEFNSNDNADCYSDSDHCKKITLIGDTYFHRILDDSASSTPEEFNFTEVSEYLKSQGFVFIREVAKGWQFEETYQKINGGNAQIINISSKPINLTFPENDEYPTSDGVEFRIFVSSVFEIPTK